MGATSLHRRFHSPWSGRCAPRSRLRLGLAAFAVVGGCGTEVAQTAYLGPDHLLDCTAPGSSALPDDGTFGDGGGPASLRVANTYDAGQGPGLYVTARDAFRVYLNGAVVTESSAARQTIFVPLTLLPGDNAVSVVVQAKRGTPAVLLQIDDLDQSTVSDTSWRVSRSPGAGYASPSYDDSTWSPASDYGVSLPGCEPGAEFPSPSAAHWIGPGPESSGPAVLRKVIHIAPIGYAAGTTGGGAAQPVEVSGWADLAAAASDPTTPAVILLPEGLNDFRSAPRDQQTCPSTCSAGSKYPSQPEYSVLTSTQTCANALVNQTRSEQILSIGSNKTIVGLGRGAAIAGVTFDFGTSHNVIVRNVALYDVNPDLIAAGSAFLLSQANGVWIDHGTTKWVSAGFTNLNPGAEHVTLSWMHYDGVTTYECDGQHSQAVTVNDGEATIHHSYFDNTESHSPTVQNGSATVHLFNNLLSDNPGYGVGAVCGGQVLMEGNTFQRVGTPTERDVCSDGGGALGLIDAPDGSNYYGDDVGAHHGGDGGEPHDPVFTPPYPYTLDVPQSEWMIILARAGAGGPWAQPLSLP